MVGLPVTESLTILVAEDDYLIQEMLEEALTEAASGRRFCRRRKKRRPF